MTDADAADFDEIARRVTGWYGNTKEVGLVANRVAYWYVRTKLDMDPVVAKLHDLAADEAFGDVLDLGCGRGQVGVLLGEAGLARSIRGLDWDEEKVRIARDVARALPIDARFENGDVRTAPLGEADTVLLVDVLHYLAPDEQDVVLARAADAARQRVIVRDVDPEQGSASTLTKSWDWLTTTLGFNRGAGVMPRSFEDMSALLEARGFTVTREPCSTRALSNVLLVARRHLSDR